MMQIPCIFCGPRDENEFICGGTSHIARPPLAADDRAWGEYLFFRENPKGLHLERWRHVHGCGRWFNVARDTVTHRIVRVYAMTSAPGP
ncbi:MAG TPA: sarcosine oxidase subunit delta [Steroidobacteraceae bacterium]|nr:sarcosine oxidase subunit delta [Steroidobacteraceae bacterium]